MTTISATSHREKLSTGGSHWTTELIFETEGSASLSLLLYDISNITKIKGMPEWHEIEIETVYPGSENTSTVRLTRVSEYDVQLQCVSAPISYQIDLSLEELLTVCAKAERYIQKHQ